MAIEKPIVRLSIANVNEIRKATFSSKVIDMLTREAGLPQGVDILVPQQYLHKITLTIDKKKVEVPSIIVFIVNDNNTYTGKRLTFSNLRGEYISSFNEKYEPMYTKYSSFITSCEEPEGGALLWPYNYTIKVAERKSVELPEWVKTASGKNEIAKEAVLDENGLEVLDSQGNPKLKIKTVLRQRDIFVLADKQLPIPEAIKDELKKFNINF